MKQLIFLIALYSISSSAMSQTSMDAASNQAFVNNQWHEWSVGEMCAVNTAISPSLIITQGFLQPQEAVVYSGEIQKAITDLKVFPNPTRAIAALEGQLPESIRQFNYQMIDATGAMLDNGVVSIPSGGHVEQAFDLTTWPAGIYFLNIHISGIVKTFSIIKL